jgi:hypothetical protein
MCLWAVDEPLVKEGIGYKVVCRTEKEGEYLPEWQYQFANGTGGTSFFEENVYIVDTVYKIGVVETVNHNRMAKAYNGEQYHAAIHLYKEPLEFFHRDTHVLIECQYKEAVAEDEECIVAKSVTPIREVSEIEICEYWKNQNNPASED